MLGISTGIVNRSGLKIPLPIAIAMSNHVEASTSKKLMANSPPPANTDPNNINGTRPPRRSENQGRPNRSTTTPPNGAARAAPKTKTPQIKPPIVWKMERSVAMMGINARTDDQHRAVATSMAQTNVIVKTGITSVAVGFILITLHQ
jgi:hypothetical protein